MYKISAEKSVKLTAAKAVSWGYFITMMRTDAHASPSRLVPSGSISVWSLTVESCICDLRAATFTTTTPLLNNLRWHTADFECFKGLKSQMITTLPLMKKRWEQQEQDYIASFSGVKPRLASNSLWAHVTTEKVALFTVKGNLPIIPNFYNIVLRSAFTSLSDCIVPEYVAQHMQLCQALSCQKCLR